MNMEDHKKFWNGKMSDKQRPNRIKRFLKWLGLVVLILVVGFIALGVYGNSQAICEYKNFDRESVLQAINGLRSQSGKSSLALNGNLNEYAESKIKTIKKNDSDLSGDFRDWAKNKNDNSFNSIQAIFSYDRISVCAVKKGLEDDKQSFSALTDSMYSQVGIATSGNSAYLILAEIQEIKNVSNTESKTATDQTTANQKKNANTQYINSEIEKLEQNKAAYLNFIEKTNQTLQTCPEGFYQSCYDRIKQSTDGYYKKIDEVNEQIQEWKRKLVD